MYRRRPRDVSQCAYRNYMRIGERYHWLSHERSGKLVGPTPRPTRGRTEGCDGAR